MTFGPDLSVAVSCRRGICDAWRWEEVPDEMRGHLIRLREAGLWQIWRRDACTWEDAATDPNPSDYAIYRVKQSVAYRLHGLCTGWSLAPDVAKARLRDNTWPPGSIPTQSETTTKEPMKESTMGQISDVNSVLVVETITFVNKVPVKDISASEAVDLVNAQHAMLAKRKAAAETMDLNALKAEIAAREAGIKAFAAAHNAVNTK